jgi:hypothetical protein
MTSFIILQRSKIGCENSAHCKYRIPCQINLLDGEKFAQVPSLQERTSLLILQAYKEKRNTVVAFKSEHAVGPTIRKNTLDFRLFNDTITQ